MLRTENVRFEDRWPQMRVTVLRLIAQGPITREEWHDLFAQVHTVCLWGDHCSNANQLYACLQQDIQQYINEAQERVLGHQEDSALLRAYINEWRRFFAQCNYLPMPFGPLEGAISGTLHQSNTPTRPKDESLVRKLMLDSWNTGIFAEIRERLQNAAMALLEAERNGEAINSDLIVGVRESYVNLSSTSTDKLKIYREHFERAYVEATEQFYRAKAADFLSQNGVQAFMKYADQKLKEEETRAKRYLENRKGCTIMDRCVQVLVTDFREQILAECRGMIERNETEKLRLMYALMDKVEGGIEPMLHTLEDFIVQAGVDDMLACAESIASDPEKYVERLLSLYNRFTTLIDEAFVNDTRFVTSRDKAYKTIVNDTSVFRLEIPARMGASSTRPAPSAPTAVNNAVSVESRCPELLANYCDMLLRKNPYVKKLTSEEVEKKLKDVLLILKYVTNKDVFMKYHKTHITRRLILETSADSEKEENMVEWLRDVGMPAEYVNRLARMFQDIKISNDLNNEFKVHMRNNNEGLADCINIKVLNAGAWMRASERVPVTLPRELEDYIPQVEDFYKSKHSGRKLQWHHLLSNGLVHFDSHFGKYELELTAFQMCVMFIWNERPDDRISFDNLRLATELPDGELRRTLFSLVAFPKLKSQVMLCEPEVKVPKDFDANSIIWINRQFHVLKAGKVQKRGRLSLIGRLQLSTEKMRDDENEAIMQLRILRVQEAIVKILKMRKRVTNAQLQTELVEILKNMFLPSRKMIKEQIEWLIENAYMKRDAKDLNTFVYLA